MKRSKWLTSLQKFLKKGFWWLWTMITLLGFWITLLTTEIGERSDINVLGGSVAGGLIGLSQSLILGFWLYDSWLWIFTNIIAWGLLAGLGVGAIGWFVPVSTLLPWRFILGIMWGTLGGIWLGGWQWLYLRQQIPKAERWIIGMALVWGIGLAVGWMVGGALRNESQLFVGELMGLSLTWLIVGLGTGLIFQRLLPTKALSTLNSSVDS